MSGTRENESFFRATVLDGCATYKGSFSMESLLRL